MEEYLKCELHGAVHLVPGGGKSKKIAELKGCRQDKYQSFHESPCCRASNGVPLNILGMSEKPAPSTPYLRTVSSAPLPFLPCSQKT